MPSMNKVFLAGNLTRNPELRYTPGGKAVAQFGMAVNRRIRSRDGTTREEVLFIDVETWERQAETASEYLHKGSPVLVEGRLKLDSWESKETGERRSKLRVVGERVQFLGGRPRGEGHGEGRDGGSRDRDRRPRRDARPSGGPDRQGSDRHDSGGRGTRGSGQDAGAPASSSGSGGAERTGPASSSGSGGAGRTGPASQDRSPAEPTSGGESSGEQGNGRANSRGDGGGDGGGDSGAGGGHDKDKLPPDNEIPF